MSSTTPQTKAKAKPKAKSKVEIIRVSKNLGRESVEVQQELNQKTEELDNKAEDKIRERIDAGEIVKVNNKLTTQEKTKLILQYIKDKFTHTNNGDDKIKLLDVFNMFVDITHIKINYLEFLRIIKLNNIQIHKTHEKMPYFMIGYKQN